MKIIPQSPPLYALIEDYEELGLIVAWACDHEAGVDTSKIVMLPIVTPLGTKPDGSPSGAAGAAWGDMSVSAVYTTHEEAIKAAKHWGEKA